MGRKIAMISEHASPLATLGGVDTGGQNVYVAQVAKNLAEMGYSVDVFTRRDDPELEEIHAWGHRIRIIHVPAGPAKFVAKEELFSYMGQFTKYMLKFIQNEQQPYELIHANFWMSGMVAAAIKRELGIPFVITFHALGRVRRIFQGDNDGFPDIRFDIEDQIVKEADRIIAECPQDEEDLMNLYQAVPHQLTVVPCGYDLDEMQPVDQAEARKQIGGPEEGHLILQLGRMVPRKGVDTVIRGLARLKKVYNVSARLMIVGGELEDPDPEINPELARLTEIAREEGVEDEVIFVGRRQRDLLKYYYSAADVFVSTPWYEPFGITPLEAMACGTPVIGSNVGGIKYTVADGETGFLVPPKDPDTLAARLAQVLTNPEMLERFRINAVQRVQDYFTWEKVARQISAVYEEVTQASQPAAVNDLAQKQVIDKGFEDLLEGLRQTQDLLSKPIMEMAQTMNTALERGNKILVCGNGGSAADGQHFAAELIGRFKRPGRKALPVIALTADTALLTAWANDESYEQVFARQVEALGQPGDILLTISTSGNSKNLLEACHAARKRGVTCLGLIGKDGGMLTQETDRAVIVPSNDTARIQEVQILILHLVCELIERVVLASGPFYQSGLMNYVVQGKPPQEQTIPKQSTGSFTKSKSNREIDQHENTRWESHTGNRRSPRIRRSNLS